MGAISTVKTSQAQIDEARRLESLRVKELSIVDRPAIRRTFLLAKQMLESGMDDVEKAELAALTSSIAKSFEDAGFDFIDLASVAKQMPPDLQQALGVVIPWMRRMANQADGNVRTAIMRVTTFLASVASGNLPIPDKQEKSMSDKARMDEEEAKRRAKAKAEGKSDEEIEADEEKRRKAKSPFGGGGAAGGKPMPAGEEEEAPTELSGGKKKTKALSLDDDGSAAVIKVAEDGSVHVLAKGRKKLTEDRAASIAEAAKSLMVMLAEADPLAFEKAMEDIGKELPSSAKVPSMVKPQGEGSVPSLATKKSDDNEPPPWAQDLVKRLDRIEKARSPSTSVEGDGAAGSVPVEKSNFWGSVFG